MSEGLFGKKVLLTKESDSFQTDKWLANVFEEWYDPCPYNTNPDFDGLSLSWKDKTFVNPPYSDPLPWVQKAIQEHRKGKRIVLLLKHDTSTKWYKLLHSAGAYFATPTSRLKHRTNSSAPFPSVLVFLTEDTEQRGLL